MNPKFTARSASCISARENPGPKSYGVAPSHNKGYRPRKCSVKKHTLPERQGSTTMNSIVAFILAETLVQNGTADGNPNTAATMNQPALYVGLLVDGPLLGHAHSVHG